MEQAGTDYPFTWGQMRDYINGLNKKNAGHCNCWGLPIG